MELQKHCIVPSPFRVRTGLMQGSAGGMLLASILTFIFVALLLLKVHFITVQNRGLVTRDSPVLALTLCLLVLFCSMCFFWSCNNRNGWADVTSVNKSFGIRLCVFTWVSLGGFLSTPPFIHLLNEYKISPSLFVCVCVCVVAKNLTSIYICSVDGRLTRWLWAYYHGMATVSSRLACCGRLILLK